MDRNPPMTIPELGLLDLSIATFRLEYEDVYEYEVTVLSMRLRLAGREFSRCARSVL